MRRSYFMAGCGLALLLGAPAVALAADANTESGSTTVGELVVTATKKQERLIDVPAPVSVVQQEQIDALHVNDARDLFTLIPTAHLDEINAGTARDISIRGVGTPNLFSEPGVAMYVDEVYSSSFVNYPTQFYDLDRIEALRGPQGGLYGRNAVGGAVNIISKMPTDTLSGSLKGSYASFDRTEWLGIANLPLGMNAGVRLTGWSTDQNKGEYFNPVTNEYLDKNDSSGGRITARYQLTPQVKWTLVGETTSASGAGTILYFPAFESPKNVRRDVQPENDWQTNRVASTLTFDTDLGQFTLIGGRRNYDLHGTEDTDLSASATRRLFRVNKVTSNSLEGRWLSKPLGPVSLLAGFTYLDDKGLGMINSQRLTIFDPGTTKLAALVISNDQTLKSFSAFAEATWHITDHLRLIASVRDTQDRKTDDFDFVPSPGVISIYHTIIHVNPKKHFDRTSPGATLAWQPSDNTDLYAKVQTGFRAGGFNFNTGSLAHLPYDAETSINYEVGVKHQFWDKRAYIAATGFDLIQDHVLIGNFDFSLPPGVQGYFANLGKAETTGIELEGALKPVDGLTINASWGYLDGKFTAGPVDGNQLPAARRNTMAVAVRYEHPITNALGIDLNASYSHRDKGWQDAQNTFRLPENDLVNASAALVSAHWRAELFVQNATDDTYAVAFGGIGGVINNPGRRVGFSLEARF